MTRFECFKAWMEMTTQFVGAVGITVGLFYTGYQIHQAGRQAEASRVYDIQKDGRELMMQIIESDVLSAPILPPSADEQTKKAIASQIIFNMGMQYYASVRAQRALGLISQAAWDDARPDMCAFMSQFGGGGVWKAVSGTYDGDFRKDVETCAKQL